MGAREQIGPSGLASLLIGFLMGSTQLLPNAARAEEDAWLAVLLAGAGSLPVIWLYTSLARRFPGHSLIGYSRLLLGRWFGGLIGWLYIWYAFHMGAMVLRTFGDFLLVTILPATPLIVVVLTLMLLCAYGARHGLETLARSSQYLILLMVIEITVISVLLLGNIRLEFLLPVVEDGLGPVIQGAFSAFSFPFGETVLFGMLLHHVRPVGQSQRSIFMTILAVTVVMAAITARDTMVLGSHLMGTSRFPTLAVIREIDIADFITRLDSLVIALWVAIGFVKAGLCLYLSAAGIAELVGVSEYRPTVLPLGAMMTTLAVLLFGNISEMSAFTATVYPVYAFPLQVIIPLILLGAAWLRGRSLAPPG